MSSRRLLPEFSRISILLLSFAVCSATAQTSCPPSSCGDITDIRYPFRLRSDPQSCGYNSAYFELDCRNNQTILNAYSKGYFVREINYDRYSIRLVEPGVNIANLSSCPLYSNVYTDFDFYSSVQDRLITIPFDEDLNWNALAVFVHCLAPMTSNKYVEAPFCGNRSSKIFSNSSEIFSYAFVGGFILSDLEESCTVDRVNMATARRLLSDSSSLASIYDALAYGVELTWFRIFCEERCYREQRECRLDDENRIRCFGGSLRGGRLFRAILYEQFGYWGPTTAQYVLLVVGAILTLRFLVGFPYLVGLVVNRRRMQHLSMDETIEEFLQAQNNLTPIKYSYSDIKKMTNNFNEKLGEGGYGTVYKGKLRSGPYVAVKMMGESVASDDEFVNEVRTIGRIHHVNVVQLVGFCVEGSRNALVYEFMPNGSLDRYIFRQEVLGGLALMCDKMFGIALGVARGIDYLHRGCDMQILHFDIKPHNILLDENFNPKISDFGLAKLYPTDHGAINLTAARGTVGYMAPEMFYKNIGGVSYKADVYSFGMLLMEMVGRSESINPFADGERQIYFPSWVYDRLYSGKEIEIEDATEEERKMVKKIVIVALWCIQMNPVERPSMNKVVEMLEGDSALPMPSKPFLAPREIAEDHELSKTPVC